MTSLSSSLRILLVLCRYEAYRLTGQDLKSRVIQFTNEVSVALGFDYPVDISIALYTSLSAIQYIRYFLDQVRLQ